MTTAPVAAKILDAMGPTLQVLTPAKIEQLKGLIANPNTKPKDFTDALPPESIVAILVASGEQPTGLAEVFHREMGPVSALVERELPGLIDLDAFKLAAIIAHQTLNGQNTDPQEIEDPNSQPTAVAAILNIPFLVGVGDVLNPVSRILIRTNHSERDLEFFANAEQLSAIASTFTVYLAQMLTQRASLANKGVAKIADPASVANAVNRMEQSLKTIKQLAGSYGISLGKTTPNEPENAQLKGSETGGKGD